MPKQLLSAIKISALALVLSFGLSYALAAWTAPTALPPDGNAAAPINVGGGEQTKIDGDICTQISGVKKCLQTVGGGSSLPSGVAGQTLRNIGGTNWATSSLVFNNGTNVGIGTTSLGARLTILGDASFDPLQLKSSVSGAESYRVGPNVGGVNGFGVYDDGSALTRLSILKTSGNVGIGTTTPAYKLDVNGTIRAGANALLSTGGPAGYYQDAGNGAYRAIVGPTNNTGFYFQTNAGLATTMFVGLGGPYNGNVGIGTTAPAAKLHVSAGNSSMALFGPNASWGGQLIVGAATNTNTAATAQVISTDGNLHLDPAPSKNMYLGYYQPRDMYLNANGGNVGIGTTAPLASYKLDVNGNINANGIVYASGNMYSSDYYSYAAGKWFSTVANSQVGVSQTWQDVTASRVSSATYTNSTGRPIMVAITHTSGLTFTVSGVLVGSDQGASNNTTSLATFMVPVGATYVAVYPYGVSRWTELR